MKKENLSTIANALKAGEVVIIPTETVYGIAADARNNSAVQKIYEIKSRSFDKPLQLMVADLEIAKEYLIFSEIAENVAKNLLPGALTMVLEKKENSGLSANLNHNNKTLGLRIPNHIELLKLLATLDFPIAATSANLSGGSDNIVCDDAMKNLKNSGINYALDGGECLISTPSTVADFTKENVTILREGIITLEQIKKAGN